MTLLQSVPRCSQVRRRGIRQRSRGGHCHLLHLLAAARRATAGTGRPGAAASQVSTLVTTMLKRVLLVSRLLSPALSEVDSEHSDAEALARGLAGRRLAEILAQLLGVFAPQQSLLRPFLHLHGGGRSLRSRREIQPPSKQARAV